MEFRQYWQTILRHKTLILILVASASLTGFALTYVVPESYEATVTLLMRPQRESYITDSSSLLEKESLGFPLTVSQAKLVNRTCSEILQNREIAERIVRQLGLDKMKKEPAGNVFKRAYEWVKDQVKGLVLATWTIMKYGRLEENTPFNEWVNQVKNSMTAQEVLDTYLVELTVTFDSPELAAKIANAAAEELVQYSIESNRDETSVETRMLGEWVERAHQEYMNAIAELKRFKEEKGIVNIDDERSHKVDVLSRFEEDLKENDVEIAKLKREKEALLKQISSLDKEHQSAETIRENPTVTEIKSILANDEITLAGLRERFTDDHPSIVALKARIEDAKKRLDQAEARTVYDETSSPSPPYENATLRLSEIDSLLSARNGAGEALQQTIEQLRSDISGLPALEQGLQRLGNQVFNTERIHTQLKKAFEDSRIVAARSEVEARVIHPAAPPLYPSSPIKILYVGIAAGVSLFLGVGLAFFLEYLNVSLRTVDRAEEVLEAPVYTTIPIMRAEDGRPGPLVSYASGLDTGSEDHGTQWRQFRDSFQSLETNLVMLAKDAVKSLTITSSIPGEGKSMMVCNLAERFALSGKRVLVVDADMRRPTVHKIYQGRADRGLMELLAEGSKVSPEEVLQTWSDRVAYLSAGGETRDPLPLLRSDRFRNLMEQFTQAYDVVLIDSPPVLAAPDATILAARTNGVLLVLNSGVVKEAEAIRAKKQIEAAGGSICGLVLNRFDEKAGWKYHPYEDYYTRAVPDGRQATPSA